MKPFFSKILLISISFFFINSSVATKLEIVTTTSDLKNLVEIIGKDRVIVTSLVPPNLDAEEYQPRTQDLVKLRNAKLVLILSHHIILYKENKTIGN